jgi:hypothetical protein
VSNSGAIKTLSNSGAIRGGRGGRGFGTSFSGIGGRGGVDVSNAGTITSLSERGRDPRRKRGRGSLEGVGGAGVSSAGTIKRLTNNGKIGGGNDGASF